MVLQGADSMYETDLFAPCSTRSRSCRGRLRRGGPGRPVAADRRRAQPHGQLPDRRRGAAVQRGPGLHPAPAAAPLGPAPAPARGRGPGPGPRRPAGGGQPGRGLAGAGRPALADRAGGGQRGESVLAHPCARARPCSGSHPPDPGAGRGHASRRHRLPAPRHLRVPLRADPGGGGGGGPGRRRRPLPRAHGRPAPGKEARREMDADLRRLDAYRDLSGRHGRTTFVGYETTASEGPHPGAAATARSCPRPARATRSS